MLRKRHGQVVYLAPASSEGSVDGLGSVFSDAFGTPSQAEVDAVSSVDAGESEETDSTTDTDSGEVTNGEAEASSASEANELITKLEAAIDENKALAGQITALTTLNDKLNGEKSQLQVKLDAQASDLVQAQEANEALKPAAIRQIKTLSIALNQPVAEDLGDKSAKELGSTCASLLSKMKESVPAGQKSASVTDHTASAVDGLTSKQKVPTAAESGLSGI